MLTWTTTLPTQPGWYVLRYRDDDLAAQPVVVVEVYTHEGGLLVAFDKERWPSYDFHEIGTPDWLGPLTLDTLAGDCALCHGLTPQPGDTIEEFLDGRHEALPANTECHCGAWLDEHTAQHPHGCASSNCRGWRAREEGP